MAENPPPEENQPMPVATPFGLVCCQVRQECEEKSGNKNPQACQECSRNNYAQAKKFDYYSGFQKSRETIMMTLKAEVDKLTNQQIQSGNSVVFVIDMRRLQVKEMAVIDHLAQARKSLEDAVEHTNKAISVVGEVVHTYSR